MKTDTRSFAGSVLRRMFTIVALLLVPACARTRPGVQLMLGNAGTETIRDVRILFEGSNVFETASLAPLAESPAIPLPCPLPPKSTVMWRTTDDRILALELAAPTNLPAGFIGRIYYQVKSADDARIFLIDLRKSAEGTMPWGKPENWEGAVGLPGMSYD